MSLETELSKIERGFWERVSRTSVRIWMGPAWSRLSIWRGVKTNAEIGDMAKGMPSWRDVEIDPKGFLQPTADFALINYHVATTRHDGERHTAIITTGFALRDGVWKAAFHGQALFPQ